MLLHKLLILKLNDKNHKYKESIKKNEQMKNEYKYIYNYNHKVIIQTGYLERELENFRQDFKKHYTKVKTLQNLTIKSEDNDNSYNDTQIDELIQKISFYKLKIAGDKEKLDNINDDFVSSEKKNIHLKEKIKILDQKIEELTKEKSNLKSLLYN